MGFFQDPGAWLKNWGHELDFTSSKFKPSTFFKTIIPVAALADAPGIGFGGKGGEEFDKGWNKVFNVKKDEAGGEAAAGPPGAAGPMDTSLSDEDRAQMAQFIAALRAQAAGTGGPSLAQGQLQQATDSNVRNAMAMARSSRGLGNQAQLRSMLENQARAQQQGAGQSALLRNQEMMQGQQLLGTALGAQRSADLQQMTAVQQAALQQQQLNQNWVLGQQAAANQKRGQDNAFLGSLLQTGGTVLGAVYGGPGGAAAGGAAGKWAGDALSTPDVEPATDYSQDMMSYQAPKPMSAGGMVPGRAPAAGDAHGNDTVPAMLSPGEIVLPRTVAQGEDAPDKAAEFVAALKAQKAKEAGSGPDHQKLYKVLSDRLRRVEMAYGGEIC